MNKILYLLLLFSIFSCSNEGEQSEDTLPENLFQAERKDSKIFFYIPDSLLGRDMLLITRFAGVPEGFHERYAAGSKCTERLVYWEKQGDFILFRARNAKTTSKPDDPLNIAIQVNSFSPVIEKFKIKSSLTSGGVHKVDVSSFFAGSHALLSGWYKSTAEKYDKYKFDEDRSWLDSFKAFPKNLEIRYLKTYIVGRTPNRDGTSTMSFLMNYSLVLLPEAPVKPRIHDPRVGWFTVNKKAYTSDIAGVQDLNFIKRWNLVPCDLEAYQSGELVEPIKPITFYIDPATPLKWRPYFKQGVEAWNSCFETAGFRNALFVEDVSNDPDFHPEDVRYNVIRYVTNETRNATGPSVSDPRSGEIIESDIIWYHNVFDLLRNRYLIETGATNPLASQLFLPDSVMGQLVSYVISHEVGHALGLSHNMKASSAYPVDSLRSASFTKEYGITPTLMDYARFNYIAQPGDEEVEYIAAIGPYDHIAINWGYRYYPHGNSAVMGAILRGSDLAYQFSKESINFDPSTQTECLGDDNIKASTYALKNLRTVAGSLGTWALVKGAEPKHLTGLHQDFLLMWYRYQMHVLQNIGGVLENKKVSTEEGAVYRFVPKSTQQHALAFLLNHAFRNQAWLVPDDIQSRIYPEGAEELVLIKQRQLLENLLHPSRLARMLEHEVRYKSSAYSPKEMLAELTEGLLTKTSSNDDHSLRTLQRHYLLCLNTLSQIQSVDGYAEHQYSELSFIAYAELQNIYKVLINQQSDHADKSSEGSWHTRHLLDILEKSLKGDLSDVPILAFNIEDNLPQAQGCFH